MQQKILIDIFMKAFDNFDYLKELFLENKDKGCTLIVIGDQMQKIDYNLVNIFTIYSHHYNVTWLLLSQ